MGVGYSEDDGTVEEGDRGNSQRGEAGAAKAALGAQMARIARVTFTDALECRPNIVIVG